ncbi:MAG TPA: serine/threonine-protein kinase [Ktedonobacteraceae bacterium]
MALETMKNNRYRMVRPLGSGSTGEVYLVEDTLRNRQEVVLKLLHAYAHPLTHDAQSASRAFRFEAGAISQLTHPNILPLLDYGAETVDGEVVPFIVTPYCSEGSLATWLEKRSNDDVLTLEDAARLVRQVAGALQYAHDQGIVHRDVKSANVFIRSNLNGPPAMLVADFGFAQPIPEARVSGLDVRGTPEFMAPEQWEGQVVPASDQYALGVLVYQLLTGRLPFQGSIEQLRDAHLRSWPTPPSAINPTLSPEIDAVVGRALAKKPGERYPTVTAFADAFTQAIQPVPEPAAPPPEGMDVGNVTGTPPPPTPTRRLSPGMIILISVLALLVVLGGIGLIANAYSNKSAQSSANATATANTNVTGTANVHDTGTAQTNSNANSTATANTHATATAQTHGNANTTATANAQATGNANATATVLPAAQLSGNWVNAEQNITQGITKMTITNNGTNVTVHPFSKCSPTDCDWGTKSNQYTGSPFKIVFVVNGSTESLAISTQGTQLTVVDTSSTNGTHTYLFDKG